MRDVWAMCAELRMEPGDLDSGRTLGFMNIAMQADSKSEFLTGVLRCLRDYHWELLGTENIRVLDIDKDHGDAMNGLIEHALVKDGYVGLGTFHTYKPE